MNPLLMAYVNTDPLEEWAQASAIVVTGTLNRYAQAFQDARHAGAIVAQYWMTFECPDDLDDPLEQEMYFVNGAPPPRWPYKDANGNDRVNWKGTHLLDIRPSSPYFGQMQKYARNTIAGRLFDAFMLDGHGYRLWSKTKTENGVTTPGADWDTWPKEEQQTWTAAMIEIARMVHDLRLELWPEFEIYHNNVWDNYKAPGSEEAMQYANGCVGENWKYDPWHIGYVAKPWAAEPLKKRVLIISPNQATADAWKVDPNVTHITVVDKSKGQNYKTPTPPIVDYDDERPPDPCAEYIDKVRQLEEENAALRADNLEQAEKIKTLEGTLAEIHAASSPIDDD